VRRFPLASGRRLADAVRRRWRPLAAILLVAAVVYTVFGILIPVRYFTLFPGPAPDVATLVVPVGPAVAPGGPGEGRFLLTTIEAAPATPFELWRLVTRPLVRLAPRSYLVPEGMDDEAYDQWSFAAMAESQLAAASEAWSYLGRETRLVSDGAEVFFVSRSSSAAAQVKAGDVLVAWSLGERAAAVVLSDDFERGVLDAYASLRPDAAPPELTLRLSRDGRPVTVRVGMTADDFYAWPLFGLALGAANPRTDPPVPVSFPEGDIGGPSGGLMLTLEIIDDFTPGDLTLGRVIAGSGTMGPGGEVGPVGGIDLKIAGAAAAGASFFLVPDEDYEEARLAVADQRLVEFRLVAVGTLEEALAALASLTGKNGPDYNRADLPPALEQVLWVALKR